MSDWEEFEETYLRKIRDSKSSAKMKVSGKEIFALEKELNKPAKARKKKR